MFQNPFYQRDFKYKWQSSTREKLSVQRLYAANIPVEQKRIMCATIYTPPSGVCNNNKKLIIPQTSTHISLLCLLAFVLINFEHLLTRVVGSQPNKLTERITPSY